MLKTPNVRIIVSMELLSELSLWGLGLSAFLAATILPLSSELVLSALLLAGENPLAVMIIATFANVLGSIVNYLIGRWGADDILHRWFKLTQQQTDKAEQQFNRYGKWSLLIVRPISVKCNLNPTRLNRYSLSVRSVPKVTSSQTDLKCYLELFNP